MGYMYYVNLGSKGYIAPDGTYPQSGFGLNNVSYFHDLQSDHYWSGTEYSANPDLAWVFYFGSGYQYNFGKGITFYAWAVRDGDVGPVPVPGAVWLLGSGLIGLLAMRKKFRKT
jgi:hypothetical protein